jgi:hypothetical protein
VIGVVRALALAVLIVAGSIVGALPLWPLLVLFVPLTAGKVGFTSGAVAMAPGAVPRAPRERPRGS